MNNPNLPRAEISSGAVLLLGLLFYLNPARIFWPFLLAAACHEAGHLLAAYLLGGRVHRIQIRATGAILSASFPTYGGEFFALLAGPAVNLLLGAGFLRGWFPFSLINLGLALFNLLPVHGLDGGRLLYLLLLKALPPDRAERVVTLLSYCLCLGIAAWGLYASLCLRWGMWVCLCGVALALRLGAKNALAK